MMSVGIAWPDGQGVIPGVCSGVDDDLRLCLDRSSDSDTQLELTELIESITCDDVVTGDVGEGSTVVAGIVERLLDQVEAEASAARRPITELSEIDGDKSRDKKSRHREPNEDATKKVRRKRERDHERKKSRRRSTSCSTTSSACSESSRKHRRKHKHHRRKQSDPSPRVNPIFLWVKQDDTRIVEVLCEDYDKRNRIRLTKTAHGWRATPRTERLDSALSRSSLDLSPSPSPITECPPSLVSPPRTKEKKKTKRCVSRKYKRCDRKKDIGFTKNNYVDDKNVDVVNNNYCNITNNNNDKHENRIVTESSLSDPSFRSFGYKKACHNNPKVNKKKKDNKRLGDIDVYTFVSTPKTDSERESEPECEPRLNDLNIKQEIDIQESDIEVDNNELQPTNVDIKSEHTITKNEVSGHEYQSSEDDVAEEDIVDTKEAESKMKVEPTENIVNGKVESPPNFNHNSGEVEEISNEGASLSSAMQKETIENSKEIVGSSTLINGERPEINLEREIIKETPSQSEIIENSINESIEEQNKPGELVKSNDTPKQIVKDPDSPKETLNNNNEIKSQFNEEDIPKVDSSIAERKEDGSTQESKKDFIEETADEEILPDIILPEPHLQTPEPSPQPVPEPSSAEPENSITEISLQPDTSLDSDTIHLPDTTTKSDTSILISTDISLGQKLSIPKQRNENSRQSTLLEEQLSTESKPTESLHQRQQTEKDLKAVALIEQEEIERQITADLDEDHLLAIEEILQGEECVEDFDDDDLPEEYSGSHESPVNLVLDLKSKDQFDNRGIPLSLRTDDFLEMFPTPPPLMKEQPEITITPTVSKKTDEKVLKTIPPAHQQSKTKFLESILSCPKRCHKGNTSKSESSDQQEPLYLGVSRKSASPTVSSSDGRKFSSPDLEPKPKRMKVEDITLKTILNRNKESYPKTKVNKPKDPEEIQQTADSTTKSRLLELLTNENDEHISKMDPLTQLKEVLSDPDLNVPDPLLVPRARLPALVANPAKEIPRLLAMKSENFSYPKLLTDPDLLVVSLSHLQSLLQAAGKEEEILKYQQQAQLLQQQMKQEQATLDAATATALNQMMWLPYLSQLEAAAMACGNTQDFMTMLNMVFPSGAYSQMNPYIMSSTSPGINAYDYKSQLEFQQAFALWNEAMMQAATNQFTAQSLASATTTNISKLYQNYQDTKYNPKSHSTSVSKHQDTKYTSARTSPISHNYQQNKYRTSSQYPYTSMFSIPTSTPTTSLPSATPQYKTTSSIQQQSYQNSRQRGYNYNSYASLNPTVSKTETAALSGMTATDLYGKPHQKINSSNICNNSNKSLMNYLSKPKQTELKGHHVSKAYPTSTTMLPKDTGVTRMSSTTKIPSDPPKLKVKQPQHLVDPNSRPKLFNFDEHGEVGSTTGSLTPQVDESHHNLWHPLFSSHQQKSYSSPWQWTTPVTVSGE